MKITGLSLDDTVMSNQLQMKASPKKFLKYNELDKQPNLSSDNSDLYYSKIQVLNEKSNGSQKLLHTNQSNKEQNSNGVVTKAFHSVYENRTEILKIKCSINVL